MRTSGSGSIQVRAVPWGPADPASSPVVKKTLTPKQLEVLRLTALGLTIDEVMHEMRIGKARYCTLLAGACERLGVPGGGRIAAWTVLGWLRVPHV